MQPYAIIRKNNEVIDRITFNASAEELSAHCTEIAEQIRAAGYDCEEEDLEFLPAEREAQGPDTPPRAILDLANSKKVDIMTEIIIYTNTAKFAEKDAINSPTPEQDAQIVEEHWGEFIDAMQQKAEQDGYALRQDDWADTVGGPTYSVNTDELEAEEAAHQWMKNHFDFWDWYN